VVQIEGAGVRVEKRFTELKKGQHGAIIPMNPTVTMPYIWKFLASLVSLTIKCQ
jgi:hypothetical protein